ncbi:hypothetical protein SDC9_197761 [bioreactor metagenome]|uniref:Uncharacterized protein n=1 Tax=bioreactor metagenome TaxID=1076179 RepID=A0A645IFR8_9ZZZZ|nr:hypothetical protein [Aminobacterium sp.]MEA4876532.1 hypothetical protein [Aminobacterium sp.]
MPYQFFKIGFFSGIFFSFFLFQILRRISVFFAKKCREKRKKKQAEKEKDIQKNGRWTRKNNAEEIKNAIELAVAGVPDLSIFRSRLEKMGILTIFVPENAKSKCVVDGISGIIFRKIGTEEEISGSSIGWRWKWLRKHVAKVDIDVTSEKFNREINYF